MPSVSSSPPVSSARGQECPTHMGTARRKRMRKMSVLVFAALLVFPVAAQDGAKVVYSSGKQMDADLHKLPLNNLGEAEIDLIEHTGEHAAILLRRTAPGKAEVHANQADIWYVIDGGCIFVTGGKVMGGAQTDRKSTRLNSSHIT